MRPVKKSLMELNPADDTADSHVRYRRAVIEIGDHVTGSLAQWGRSEERAQWRK